MAEKSYSEIARGRRPRASLASGAVLESALRQLAARTDTAPGLQTLMVEYGRRGGMAGVGIPATPGHRLPIGVIGFGSGRRGPTTFVGIADPRAVRVTSAAPRVDAPVRDGLYGFSLPRGAGKPVLRELAADGTVLRRDRIR